MLLPDPWVCGDLTNLMGSKPAPGSAPAASQAWAGPPLSTASTAWGSFDLAHGNSVAFTAGSSHVCSHRLFALNLHYWVLLERLGTSFVVSRAALLSPCTHRAHSGKFNSWESVNSCSAHQSCMVGPGIPLLQDKTMKKGRRPETSFLHWWALLSALSPCSCPISVSKLFIPCHYMRHLLSSLCQSLWTPLLFCDRMAGVVLLPIPYWLDYTLKLG